MPASSHRILIVDDDLDNLANLSDILRELGYCVDVATDGETALSHFSNSQGQQKSYDLCLLDFKMPGMDGVELFRRIRQAEPDQPAIMITAYAGEDGMQRAEEAGTCAVLKKPVEISNLLEIMKQALSN